MIFWIPIVVVILDQLTKALIMANLPIKQGLSVMPCFNLVHVMNRGVSFSFLTSDSPAMPWILTAFALGVCGLITCWMKHEKDTFTKVGLSLVLGGAIGNVVDRVRFGAVVDFLDFYVGDWHWPAFNVADSAICIGVALIIIRSFQKKENKK